jgi:hypothetical protein
MASQMLPKEYGGGGMSPGQAKGALMAALKVPDNADQRALDQREELRGSLTKRYETTPLKPGETPPTKDLTTDQGIVNSFDFTDVDNVSRQWQSDLAKDPVIGYTDPQTGLSYAGALAEKTPTMEWFDKYGLPYANKRYDDPDEIRRMQDAVAPVAPGQLEAEDLQNQQALSANARARADLGEANSQMDVLDRAYREATKSGILKPSTPGTPGTPDTKYTMGLPRQQSTPTAGLQVAATDATGKPTMYRTETGALVTPEGMAAINNTQTPRGTRLGDVSSGEPDFITRTIPGTPGTPGTPGRDTFLMDIGPNGRLIGLSNNQNIPAGGKTDKTKMGAGVSGQTNFDFSKAGTVLPATASPLEALGLKPLVPGSNRRVMTAEDLAPAAQRIAMAKRAAAATVPGIQRAGQSSEASMQRQLARARLMGLAAAGRTPLSDTLAGRMMAARTAGVYG